MEMQRAKGNRSQQSSFFENDDGIQNMPFNRRTGKMTINQYINNSRSTQNLPKNTPQPSTIKSSMIEPYSERVERVERVEKHSVKSSILSQPS